MQENQLLFDLKYYYIFIYLTPDYFPLKGYAFQKWHLDMTALIYVCATDELGFQKWESHFQGLLFWSNLLETLLNNV